MHNTKTHKLSLTICLRYLIIKYTQHFQLETIQTFVFSMEFKIIFGVVIDRLQRTGVLRRMGI